MKKRSDLAVLIDRIPYAEGNIGEEAILTSLLQDLQTLGITKISVLSNMWKRISQRHGGQVRVIADKPGRWSFLPAEVKKADLLIWGGGHMLQDRSSQLYIPYVTKTLLIAKFLGVPRFIYAPGLGPVINRFGRFLSRQALTDPAGITVRDQISADFLAQIGISKEVKLTADPAFSLTTSSDELPPPPADRPPIIGFACRKHFYRTGSWLPVSMQSSSHKVSQLPYERFLQEAAATLDKAVEVWGAQVRLIPMDLGPNPRDDLICHRLRILMVHQDAAQVLDDDPPLAEFIRRLNDLDLLISSRLHGIILGLRFGLPFIGIDSDGKIEQMANSIGYGTLAIKDRQLERDWLFDAMNRILNNRQEIRRDLQRHGMELRRRAQVNRLALEQCLQSLVT